MTDKLITHEEAREIAKKNLHWSERKPMLNYIKQQEQFAKDVARYFELEQQFYDGFFDDVNVETLDEMNKESEALKEKLSKVGKGE